MSALITAVVVGVALLAAPAGGRDQVALSLVVTDDAANVVRPVLGDLVDGDVLHVSVTGADGGATAEVHQCELVPSGFSSCRNGFPVLFDGDGRALFQYQVRDGGACGPNASCVVLVSDDDGPLAWAYLVFGAPAPAPPQVGLDPAGPYEEGDVVHVLITGSGQGVQSEIALCGERCSPTVHATAGPDGVAQADVTIDRTCDDCGIRVVSGPSQTFVPIDFAAPDGPDYSPQRLLPLLALAALFLVVAWRVATSTDWRPPSEAAVPEFEHLDERVDA